METLIKILIDYGPGGLVLVVVVYMLLKGQIEFRYPRSRKEDK